MVGCWQGRGERGDFVVWPIGEVAAGWRAGWAGAVFGDEGEVLEVRDGAGERHPGVVLVEEGREEAGEVEFPAHWEEMVREVFK